MPEGDIAVLPQFSTAVNITESMSHTEVVDEDSVSCNQVVESVI